jgi:hypothetical protein
VSAAGETHEFSQDYRMNGTSGLYPICECGRSPEDPIHSPTPQPPEKLVGEERDVRITDLVDEIDRLKAENARRRSALALSANRKEKE